MISTVDILENDILENYPDVLDKLLRDHTTQNNILWATDNYENIGDGYSALNQIKLVQITGENGNIIMPRVQKINLLQKARAKEMAEVFTPSWICNAQNNLIDEEWFGKKDIFNTESDDNINRKWETNNNKINFPEGKTWKDYVKLKRLEITCGEAPYITSRYDTTTGEFIEVQDRIGLLDRKLRIINENVTMSGEWLKATQTAYKNMYGFEWQGDSLLLAREAMLITFIENYIFKFNKEPLLKSIQYIAYIISWNIWQMDGLKGVVPYSCTEKTSVETNLFNEEIIKTTKCEGCEKGIISKHNGTKSRIRNWGIKDKKTGKSNTDFEFFKLLETKLNEI